MAAKRRPLITVVEARPMAEVNFRGFKNNMNNNIQTNKATALSNDHTGKPSSLIISNASGTVSSTNKQKICNSNDQINSKKENAVKKPPVPVARKSLIKAQNEILVINNESELKANNILNYSPCDDKCGMPVVIQKSRKNVNEISTDRTEIDSSLMSKALFKFGGNWFDDKKEFGTSDPSLKASKTTIIRPKSTFIDKGFLPVCKSNNSDAKTDYDNFNNDLHSKSKVEIENPAIIKRKSFSKSLIDLSENNDKQLSKTEFKIHLSDFEQSNEINIHIKDDTQFTKDKNYNDLIGLDISSVSVNEDSEQNILKTLNETRPPRPAVGPKLQNSFTISSCSWDDIENDGPRALAMFDYQSGNADDLNFKVGEIIMLDDSIDGEWLKGHKLMSNEFGIFPSNYVQILQSLPNNHPDVILPSYIDDKSKCVARFDFEGVHDNGELSFKQGDVIFLVRKINSEWFEGKHCVSNEKGIFPTSFVEVIQNVAQECEDKTEQKRILKKATALYDFNGGHDGDLEFKAGDIIDVFNQINCEWMEGRIGEQSGIFPASFVSNQ